MQHIRLGETAAAQIEIPFTSVLASNLQSRILAATLANASIVVYVKKGNVGTAVLGAGAFATCDDTHAPGVRGYQPLSSELVTGISTFIFTGTNMEPREVPVMVTPADPYLPEYRGAVIAGTLTTSAFSTDLSPTDTDHWKNAFLEWLTGNNAGSCTKIGGSSGAAGKVVTLASGFVLANAPVAGDKFRIVKC
jgi:hypothetical protein